MGHREEDNSGVANRRRSLRSAFISTTALVALVSLDVTPGHAGPNGGQVAGGKIKIDRSGETTTVIQRSKRGIINWRSFDVDAGETVIFKQPKRTSITLNRVTGGTRSDILGSLQANGRVWIVNPNGVFVGPTAAIDVGGLVMTTADIRDQDFMNGRYQFDIPSDHGTEAEIVNEGRISLRNRGVAALVAPHVRNDGVIQGKLSTVVLGGAETFGIDFYGDGLINFEIKEAVREAPASGDAIIENSGLIKTPGGRVLMTAEAVSGVIDSVINTDGIVEAETVKTVRGEIILSGGSSGSVSVAGLLEADGDNRGERGGTVKLLGEHVSVADNTVIDTTGRRGGGEILVGGNFQGEGPEPNALTTAIGSGAELLADATGKGRGGRVIVWSDERTDAHGFISVRGGERGGRGGFIEVSSKGRLRYDTPPDLSAPKGRPGSMLIDPPTLTVEEGGGSDIDGSSVDPDVLEVAGDITVDASDAIIFNAPVTKPGNGTLFINTSEEGDPDGTVTINAPLTLTGSRSDLIIETGSIDVQADIIANGDAQFRSVFGTIFGSLFSPEIDINLTVGRDLLIETSARLEGGAIDTFGNLEFRGDISAGRDIEIRTSDRTRIFADITAGRDMTLLLSPDDFAEVLIAGLSAGRDITVVTDGELFLAGTNAGRDTSITVGLFLEIRDQNVAGRSIVLRTDGIDFNPIDPNPAFFDAPRLTVVVQRGETSGFTTDVTIGGSEATFSDLVLSRISADELTVLNRVGAIEFNGPADFSRFDIVTVGSSSSPVTQLSDAPITVNKLAIAGASLVDLSLADNVISTLGIDDVLSGGTAIDTVRVRNSTDLTIGRITLPREVREFTSANRVNGIEADRIDLFVDGSLRINWSLRASDGVLIDTGRFINNVGPGAVQTGPSDEFFIYSVNGNADTIAGLNGVVFDELTTRAETPPETVFAITEASTFIYAEAFPTNQPPDPEPRPPLPPQIPPKTGSPLSPSEPLSEGSISYYDADGAQGGAIFIEDLVTGSAFDSLLNTDGRRLDVSDGNRDFWN